MPKHTNDRLQGTLDLVVLKTLVSRGPMHGYAMTQHFDRISNSVLRVEEGSLYPGAAPDDAGGVAEGRMGAVGERTPRALLQHHRRRPSSARGGERTGRR